MQSALSVHRRAELAAALTAVENDLPAARAVLAALVGRLGGARVVGFTGPPGAGKSTLVAAVIAELRRRGQAVAVVAVDPSSPLTGGAVLGDRVRMTSHAGDPDVFIRSVASRGHLGGLTRTTSRLIDVFDGAGFPWILVETVGAGQNEVEVADLAHCRVVVCAPALGDDVQAIKAGVLEIADILAVNKADMPMAERTARQLAALVPRAMVRKVSALRGDGVAALLDTIMATPKRSEAEPLARTARLIEQIAVDRFRATLDRRRLDELAASVLRGETGYAEAAASVEREGRGRK